MKRSQIIIFILLISTLFVLNRVFISTEDANLEEQPEMVNHDKISSQRLFDNSWKIIRDNYYDKDLNDQPWNY